MQTLELTVPYKPHPGQLEFHNCTKRFRAVAPGRRWGKTFCGANETIKVATSSPPKSVGYVIAPSYGSSSLGKCWRTILTFAPQQLIRQIHRTPGNMYIEWVGGRLTYFRSAEAPESCKGESIHYAWFDEPAEMNGEIWDISVLPSLMDCHGIAYFTGTPKGSNWYKILFAKGQDPNDSEYWSKGGSSYENTIERGGYLHAKEIDSIAIQMSEKARNQEIMGIFLDDVGAVFRRIRDCIKGELEEPIVGRHYAVGCDLAKLVDCTVLVVMDENGHVVYFDRFDTIDWPFQEKRIFEVCRKYNNARLLVDSTGLGNPVYDNLRRTGLQVEGYKFTNASKADLIENLSIAIENKTISYPDIPVMLSELGLYGFQKTKGGTTTYNAPEGYHDDSVIALALAAWMTTKPMGRISFTH